jgi:hypothetical protein
MTVYEPDVIELCWQLVGNYLAAAEPELTQKHGVDEAHPSIISKADGRNSQNAILIPVDEWITSDFLSPHWEHVYITWVGNKHQIGGIVFLSDFSPMCCEFDQEDEEHFEGLELLNEFWAKKNKEINHGTS